MKLFKSLLIWTLQIVVTLFFLEVICYVFLKGSSNPLYRARRILERHETWAWMAQPGLNTKFESAAVFTDQNGFRAEDENVVTDFNKVEMLTLGPSSAFGWGVGAEATYSALVAKSLNLNYLNASQIGFSTTQGLLLWNSFLKDRLPNLKVVLIAYGINDLDNFRFYDLSFVNDLTYFAEQPKAASLINSNLLTTIDLFKNEFSLKISCSSLSHIEQRLSMDQSAQQTQALIQSLKTKNIKIIFIGTPYLRMKGKGTPYLNSGGILGAAYLYEQAEVAAAAGNCGEALEFVKRAKALEPWRVEDDVRKLAEIQKAVCKDEGISYVDIFTEFNQLAIQDEYFVDPVHPSVKGHDLIAKRVLEKLK